MAGYIGSKTSVTQVDGYNRTEADAEFVSKDGDTITTAAGTALTLDRTGSDGTILDLKKDGSTVGSIGAYGGDVYIGTGDAGLWFQDGGNAIRPFRVDTQAGHDASIDLGHSTNRFKDLYLSGGVYLGGTGSANKLDDYEEGTWTPTYTGGATSVTYTNQGGRYTKIGNVVVVKFRVVISSATFNANFLTVGGLPFIVENTVDSEQTGGFAPMLDRLSSNINNITVQPTTNSTTFIFITNNGTTSTHSGLRGTDITVNTDLRGSIIYHTSA